MTTRINVGRFADAPEPGVLGAHGEYSGHEPIDVGPAGARLSRPTITCANIDIEPPARPGHGRLMERSLTERER